MTPEQIKALEVQGARAIIVEKIIKVSDQLSEACGKYARVNLDSWNAKSTLAEYAAEIKLHSNTINTLINHLQPGT